MSGEQDYDHAMTKPPCSRTLGNSVYLAQTWHLPVSCHFLSFQLNQFVKFGGLTFTLLLLQECFINMASSPNSPHNVVKNRNVVLKLKNQSPEFRDVHREVGYVKLV